LHTANSVPEGINTRIILFQKESAANSVPEKARIPSLRYPARGGEFRSRRNREIVTPQSAPDEKQERGKFRFATSHR
jgi:hypothetical protein